MVVQAPRWMRSPLYYAMQAYGNGEGVREGKTSIALARTTNLGDSWATTMVNDARSQPDPKPETTGSRVWPSTSRPTTSTSYAAIAWGDPRFADPTTQTQDNFGVVAQFSELPPEEESTWPTVAAVLGGLVLAGIVLLGIQFMRRTT